jgi:hypothetical protein
VVLGMGTFHFRTVFGPAQNSNLTLHSCKRFRRKKKRQAHPALFARGPSPP